MKICKKLVVLLLAAILVLSLGACESAEEKMAKLAGTYTMTAVDTEEFFNSLMDSIEAYDEEIALADASSLKYVQLVTFDAEGNYSYAYDAAATEECVREFYAGYFAALYAGRTTLNDVYGGSFDDFTEEEFCQFYAELYNCADYSELIDTLVDSAYDYSTLSEPWETGTYTISGNRILCTIEGEEEAEAMGYELDGDSLTLTYSDGEEVYTKVN